MKNNIDHWYEGDEEVFVHPCDPYHRVDVLKSSRHFKIRVEGGLWLRRIAQGSSSRPVCRLVTTSPIPAAAGIEGHLCYFNEKVDLEVDGEAQQRPRTQWSLRITLVANPPVPQMRGAYTGPVLAAERLHKSVPSRQKRTLVPEET